MVTEWHRHAEVKWARLEKEKVVPGLRPMPITNCRFLSYEERRKLTEKLGEQRIDRCGAV
jgi:hypothetical protein